MCSYNVLILLFWGQCSHALSELLHIFHMSDFTIHDPDVFNHHSVITTKGKSHFQQAPYMIIDEKVFILDCI